jgi:hypothetical protein
VIGGLFVEDQQVVLADEIGAVVYAAKLHAIVRYFTRDLVVEHCNFSA